MCKSTLLSRACFLCFQSFTTKTRVKLTPPYVITYTKLQIISKSQSIINNLPNTSNAISLYHYKNFFYHCTNLFYPCTNLFYHCTSVFYYYTSLFYYCTKSPLSLPKSLLSLHKSLLLYFTKSLLSLPKSVYHCTNCLSLHLRMIPVLCL